MKPSPAILGLLLFIACLSSKSYAQGFNAKNKYSSAEISLSNAYFLGSDLPFKSNRSFSPGVSFAVMTRQSARIFNGFKFTMNYPTSRSIGRKDSLSDYGFEYFQTRIHKYEFFLMIDLIEHRARSQKRPDFIPYLYTGIGWLKIKHFMRYGYDSKETVSSITGQNYTKRSMVLPIGIGLRYKLRPYMDLSLEVIYNYTFINQLDLNYQQGFTHARGRDSYLNVNLKLGFF